MSLLNEQQLHIHHYSTCFIITIRGRKCILKSIKTKHILYSPQPHTDLVHAIRTLSIYNIT